MSALLLFPCSRSLRRLLARSLAAVVLAAIGALGLLHPAAGASSYALTPNSGCRDPPYIHSSTAANTSESWTDLDSDMTNNNPDAMVWVMPNWTPNGAYAPAFDYATVGVW